MSYTSADGKIYKDYQEYCNSDNLELDDKFRKLLAGSRTPQTEEERVWLENMRKLQSEGKIIEIPAQLPDSIPDSYSLTQSSLGCSTIFSKLARLITVMRIIKNSMFRRLATLLAFASAFASCRLANDPFMTSRLGTTEYYRWDIKSLDTVSIYNFRILDKGTFKVEEGIDTSGMAALKISGSGQYSVGQFRRLVDTLKHYSGDRKLYFIDLREESHCFANYYPVSWFLAQNVANKGLSLKDVEKDERTRFPKMKGKQLTIYNKVSDETAGVDSIAMTVNKVLFEKDLVEGSGFGYLRIPCTDHLWPDPCDIDAFIDFIKCIDTDSVWMHFHCVAGRGRTGAFMCLYDMMKSPGVSYEDISDRQSALGASSMRVKHRNPAKPDEKADNNERVSRLLYQYVQENRADGYKVSWTDWLSAHGE